MSKSILFVILFTSLTLKGWSQNQEDFSIIPKPVSVIPGKGWYAWKKNNIIHSTSKNNSPTKYLQNYLSELNIKSEIVSVLKKPANITLSLDNRKTLGPEGYNLLINKTGILIKANSDAGLFYGVQTLIQLISKDGTKVPYVEITDYPRFSYRGLHLDVCRHMFPVTFIKKYIDLMARHKFNRFHWHLTEDQGWRIEIKKYPKLQEVAAYRSETLVGHAGNSQKFDSKKYGGFYTQEEIKEIVEYAADRFVTIIPEIELPGHSLAALAAYPELGCTGGPYETATTWGVFDPVYCAGKEETFEFLQNVLDEVMQLFPGKYIHIGGDECPKTSWKKCEHCQQRIRDEKLKDEHELQSYFIQRIEKYVNAKGRQIIGWDEILEGGLAPNATVMSWRGEAGGVEAAKQNHSAIMTPGNWCYFDHYQDSSRTEPLAIGGLTPVKKVYLYDPVPPQLSSSETKFIIGAQANVWTEYIETSDHIEYMVYPRACALAEVVWSPREIRNYDDFLQRMQVHFNRLTDWNVNFATHIRKSIK